MASLGPHLVRFVLPFGCSSDDGKRYASHIYHLTIFYIRSIIIYNIGWIFCYVMAPSLTSQHWREEKSKYIDDDGNVIKMPGADYADCCHGCSLALCSVANAREPLSVEFDNSSSVAE